MRDGGGRLPRTDARCWRLLPCLLPNVQRRPECRAFARKRGKVRSERGGWRKRTRCEMFRGPEAREL